MARMSAKEKREQREREAAAREAADPARREQAAETRARHDERVGETVAAQEQMRTDAIAKLNRDATLHPDQVKSAHGEPMKPSRAGGKVIVACKLGIASIDLQITRLEEKWENTQTGPRKIMEPVRVGPVVRIRGTAYPRGTPPAGFPERPVIVNGAALNPDVDAHFWHTWLEANKLNPLVINGMIFAHEQRDMVEGQAREQKDVLSGLDPINTRGDARVTKSTRADLENITTEEERARKMERLNLP